MLGYPLLSKRYGVELIDIHSKSFNGIFVEGCPPTFEDTVNALEKCGISVDMVSYEKLRNSTLNKYNQRAEFNDKFFYLRK